MSAAPREALQPASAAIEGEQAHVRYRVDGARHRVWMLTHDGVSLYDTRSEQYIAIALPSWQWVGAPYSCPPDLALGPRGEAVITSNIMPTLWRIDPVTYAVTVHPLVLDADTEKDVGFSGLVYSARDGAFVAASSVHGSLWRIDRQFTQAQKLRVSEAIRNACDIALLPRAGQGRYASSSRP